MAAACTPGDVTDRPSRGTASAGGRSNEDEWAEAALPPSEAAFSEGPVDAADELTRLSAGDGVVVVEEPGVEDFLDSEGWHKNQANIQKSAAKSKRPSRSPE